MGGSTTTVKTQRHCTLCLFLSVFLSHPQAQALSFSFSFSVQYLLVCIAQKVSRSRGTIYEKVVSNDFLISLLIFLVFASLESNHYFLSLKPPNDDVIVIVVVSEVKWSSPEWNSYVSIFA